MNYFGMTANLIDAVLLIFGKTGKILNAKKNKYCFVVDIICLSYWFYMNINRGLYSQGASAIVSIIISIYGFRNWSKNPHEQIKEKVERED